MAEVKFRNGWNGAGAQSANWMQGEGEREIARRVQGDVTIERSGQFTNVYQAPNQSDPYLWGPVVISDFTVMGERASPEQAFSSHELFRRAVVFGPGQNFAVSASIKYAGDNYVMQLLCDQAAEDTTASFWLTLVRADGQGTEHPSLSLPAPHKRVSVTFADVASLSGLGALDVLNVLGGPGLGTGGHSYALFACGWSDPVLRYRFGMTALFYTDPANPFTSRVPVAFSGNTGQLSLTQVAYPFFPGRDHHPFTSFTAGPGIVQALNTVVEDVHKPQLAPYLAQSNDFGASWTSVPASFLTGLLYQHPAGGSDPRAFYDNGQLNMMGRFTTIIYMGGGVSLLIVPNAYVDGSIEAGTARFCPALFVGSGGTYTRQSWLGDTWYTDRDGIKLASGGDAVMFWGVTLMRTGHFATGPGRAFIPVFQAGAVRAMVTTDYGATWSFTPPVPPQIISTYIGIFNGVVTKAYKDAENPETIVFPAPDYAAGKLRFLRSKDLLQTFQPFGSASVSNLTSPSGRNSTDFNYCFANYGGHRRKPAVFPAFPGEFDQP